jgi:hypothetical protein
LPAPVPSYVTGVCENRNGVVTVADCLAAQP